VQGIAIDGPAGAGKSTIARHVAHALGFQYIDTGAIYRALTLKAYRSGVSLDDEEALSTLVNETDLVFKKNDDGFVELYMDGEPVGEDIRTPAIGERVSLLARHPRVREAIVKRLKVLAEQMDVVMDGRDIGTVVMPKAMLKIYLTASLEERHRRRLLELKQKGLNVNPEQIKDELIKRDDLDTSRTSGPLKIAQDAVVLDTTGLNIETVTETIVQMARERMSRLKVSSSHPPS